MRKIFTISLVICWCIRYLFQYWYQISNTSVEYLTKYYLAKYSNTLVYTTILTLYNPLHYYT